MLGEKIAVLVAAGGAGWEVEALQVLAAPGAGAVLLKRCVDVPDLLATAATGQARVAVVAARLDGIDADAVDRLHRAGVGVVAVTREGRDDGPPDVEQVVEASAVSELAEAVVAAAEQVRRTGEPGSGRAVPGEGGRGHRSTPTGAGTAAGDHGDAPAGTDEPRDARIVAVWGPTGAPGRTTVAVGVAAELAARGHDTLLVDADPFGGAVAQHLGVLDEVSGLLSAVRLANTGRLDVPRLAAAARTVAPHLRVLTGLPRADRWVEVRPAPFDALVEAARALCDH
ncbi:MAG TPA: hypothetical protein VH915_05395, partial [Pedococcus sp.]